MLGVLEDFWKGYRRNRAAVIGLAIVLIFSFTALFAPIISPFDPNMMGPNRFMPPSWTNIMGTDDLGRDVFSQIVSGARISLIVGFLASIVSAIIGVLIGAISGYFSGFVDDVLMRIAETFQVIPRFFLALIFVTLFGPNVSNIVLVIGILGWPVVARVVRVNVLTLKESAFVDAARGLGESAFRIVSSEILPNTLPSVVVVTSLQVAQAILIEAGLGFLGLSDPAAFSWGRTLNNAMSFLNYGWWMATFPGLSIFLFVIGMNLVGDGLTDVLNPRLKER
jgi:peptide/nickel transport system permease protein